MKPNGISNHAEEKVKTPGKLILCFDGTGNKYTGSPSDTNIVKLYQKFDREDPNQHHYYQRMLISYSYIINYGVSTNIILPKTAGIGTYSAGEASLNAGIWGKFKRSISQTVDEGIGTTFDQHVIAGYRFIMRYYNDGDQISIFGFSRGAFTARFLARMISEIGLLSMGNEEMVPFAYKNYQDWETGCNEYPSREAHEAFLKSFKTTFCRTKVKPYFLGLFDTVNSVGVLDVPFRKSRVLSVFPETATYIRHAVSVDERRAMFKAALLHQDNPDIPGNAGSLNENVPNVGDKALMDKIKEVYFPGNHGDVGGGWIPEGNEPSTSNYVPSLTELGLKDDGTTVLSPLDMKELNDPVQLSDLALEWMIGELDNLPKLEGEVDPIPITWNYHKNIFLWNFRRNIRKAISAKLHDVLAFDRGPSYWPKTLFWHFLGKFSRRSLALLCIFYLSASY